MFQDTLAKHAFGVGVIGLGFGVIGLGFGVRFGLRCFGFICLGFRVIGLGFDVCPPVFEELPPGVQETAPR